MPAGSSTPERAPSKLCLGGVFVSVIAPSQKKTAPLSYQKQSSELVADSSDARQI